MASRGQSLTVTVTAWNTGTLDYQTGDAANITLRWIKDGTSAAPANALSEVDATNAKGKYKITLTTLECTADFGDLCGKSSTTGVVIIGVQITFEQLPTALANGNVKADVKAVNAVVLTGTGIEDSDEWRPA